MGIIRAEGRKEGRMSKNPKEGECGDNEERKKEG